VARASLSHGTSIQEPATKTSLDLPQITSLLRQGPGRIDTWKVTGHEHRDDIDDLVVRQVLALVQETQQLGDRMLLPEYKVHLYRAIY
jgi:hypothetical protein